jgi:hypothetical protein
MKIKISKFPKGAGDQKIDIQIDPWDTWNMDNTLAKIIYPMLVQLRDTKHGFPSDFINDIGGESYADQESFDFYRESYDEAWETGSKRWDEALEKMIWSFGQIAYDDYDDLYHHGNPEYDWVKSDKTYPNPVTGKVEPTYQMVDKNPGEHWYDHVGHMKHQEKIQEGLDLFAKYFRNLWD